MKEVTNIVLTGGPCAGKTTVTLNIFLYFCCIIFIYTEL